MKLLNVDCMDYMRELPDKVFNLAMVDPPYGLNAPAMQMGQNLSRDDGWHREESTAVKIRRGKLNRGGGKLADRALNTMNCDWDFMKPGPEYFEELFRVSENQIIWGGNYFDLPPTRGVICWDKCQPWDNFSQWEMAWTSFDKPAKLFRFSNTGGANAEQKIHPTQKPVQLYKWLIETYGAAGQRVLDTHMGSGSSAIAAYAFGCNYVGCELDPGYFQAAKARIESETAQNDLFANS